MTESPFEQFELVGDEAALPDAFFDALAGLLLYVSQSDERRLHDTIGDSADGHEDARRIAPASNSHERS